MKKQEKLQKLIKQDEVIFSIIEILKTEKLDSKPNMGKFLKQYVNEIKIFNSNKITVYPEFKYEISKVFIKFMDGHELIMNCSENTTSSVGKQKYFLYFGCDEIQIKATDIDTIHTFFNYLFEFKFIF